MKVNIFDKLFSSSDISKTDASIALESLLFARLSNAKK